MNAIPLPVIATTLDGTVTASADNYILVFGDLQAAYTIVDRLGMTVGQRSGGVEVLEADPAFEPSADHERDLFGVESLPQSARPRLEREEERAQRESVRRPLSRRAATVALVEQALPKAEY